MSNTSSPSPLPLAAAPLGEDPFRALHQHFSHLASHLSSTLHSFSQNLLGNVSRGGLRLPPLFASASQSRAAGSHAFDVALSTGHIAGALRGTSVYTVSNSDNEFVLISDTKGIKSLGLLCFSKEDAQSLLAQVQLNEPALGRGAKVVPITLEQVYMLKVEGIAFRFLPYALQVKNALELQSADSASGFDGVPVFQSEHLSITKEGKRLVPLYFRQEDIERDLTRLARRGGSKAKNASQNILVGSLEDILKKLEKNRKDSGWDNMVFIPPGKSCEWHVRQANA